MPHRRGTGSRFSWPPGANFAVAKFWASNVVTLTYCTPPSRLSAPSPSRLELWWWDRPRRTPASAGWSVPPHVGAAMGDHLEQFVGPGSDAWLFTTNDHPDRPTSPRTIARVWEAAPKRSWPSRPPPARPAPHWPHVRSGQRSDDGRTHAPSRALKPRRCLALPARHRGP